MTLIDPTISVIIPLYNGAAFIEQALDSVAAQTLQPTEVIVVDDGSTDDGAAIVARYAAKYKLTLLRKANGGQSSARNLGISQSTGGLIALLDQDDLWYPTHLRELSRPFLSDTTGSLGWVYSDLDQITEDNKLRLREALSTTHITHPKRQLRICLQEDMFVLPSASMIARAAFDAVGGFDEALSGYEDDDLFLRLFVAKFRNVFLRKALGQWRVYPSSCSFTPRMAISRMLYARKLIAQFPDEPNQRLYYIRDVIAPRFLRQVISATRDALRSGDEAAVRAGLNDIAFLETRIDVLKQRFVTPEDLLISAIIPLYNGACYIAEALQSVIGQTLPPDEIIVVDDGSTDHGPDIVADMARTLPIRLIRQQNGGPSSARNLGVEHAHGDVIAFLDHDDVWYPHHLEQLVKPFLDPRPIPLGWSYSDLDEIDDAGAVRSRGLLTTMNIPHPKRDLMSCLQHDMGIAPSASLIRRTAFQAVGGFDEHLPAYEDDDLFLRLFEQGFDNVYLPDALAKWRMHQDSRFFSARMAAGRMPYARKLIERFPDKPKQKLFYTRDAIAPRFLRQAVAATRRALHTGDETAVCTGLNDIAFLETIIDTQAQRFVRPEDILISAIIPLYNGAPYIAQALQSVIDQTLPPDEIIVVDDGSTDDGPDIVAAMARTFPTTLPIRLIRKQNGGQSAARNLGVDHAHGDLIALLDQDDVWYSNHLEELVKPFLDPRPIVLGWSYSDIDEIDETGAMLSRGLLRTINNPHPKRDLMSCLQQDMTILPSASLIRKTAFRAVGGFDERLSGYEDDDLFLRLFLAGFDNVYLAESLSKWRMHHGSSSFSARMAVSGVAYARMLIDRFPNDPDASRYYVDDLIAPRFFRLMANEVRKAVLKGDIERYRHALVDMAFITGYLRLTRRLLARLLLLPALRIRPLVWFVLQHRFRMPALLRRFF